MQRGASAINLEVVIIFLDESVIVDGEATRLRQEAARARNIVDIAGIAAVEADDPQRHRFRQRRIDHALYPPTDAAVLDRVDFPIDAAREFGGIGPVGDDADSARLRRRAIKRTLWAGEALDAGDVIDMHVERPANGGNRLLV